MVGAELEQELAAFGASAGASFRELLNEVRRQP
jgi:hypothetical protein